jgi:hypothetical protein
MPPGALEELASRSREERIHDHWITVEYAQWWDDQITQAGLRGGPLKARQRADGKVGLSRRDVFGLAKPLTSRKKASEEAVLALLWNTLAWGSRAKHLAGKRIRGVAINPGRAATALREAIALASSDPMGAYSVLYPHTAGVRGPRKSRQPAIPALGPAFFTKVLYFAGAGNIDHPCVILDKRVAAAIRRHCHWRSLGDISWSPETYQRYVDLLGRWADEASAQLGHRVGRDEFERFLFGR